MADPKSKPGIPAWQRAHKPQQAQAEEVKQVEEVDVPAAPTPTESDEIEEPKGAEDVPPPAEAAIKTSDFETFKEQQQPVRPQVATPVQQKPSGPPIITYPEFLVEAHKPPPLITISRLWNTAQIASGIAAIIYGASKYLVTPMTENLNEARHDFATHSQGKIDEFNERLAKLVSRSPEYKKDHLIDSDASETASETSDPTELYHRDMGTQTSPLPSRRPSNTTTLSNTTTTKTPTDYQVTGLEIIKSHLDEMLSRNEKTESANKERQHKMDALRHYVDTLMYASPGISVWSTAEETSKADGSGAAREREDAVEELKKEIRGVKGSMLSAKRFPGPAMRNGV